MAIYQSLDLPLLDENTWERREEDEIDRGRLIEAMSIHASDEAIDVSPSFARRLHRLSQAKVRSTPSTSHPIPLRGRGPWLAHFVLRMFPFEPVADCLAGYGYETIGYERVFRQRRFASAQEQALVLDTLAEVGVDSRGLEADGWLYARLFLSCPRGEAGFLGPDFDRDYGKA